MVAAYYARRPGLALSLAVGLLSLGCSSGSSSYGGSTPTPTTLSTAKPTPDPRVGLRAGLTDAGEAIWNLRLVSNTPSSERFVGSTNSDLAFSGKYAIQGNYNGWQIWDLSTPNKPSLAAGIYCPASQSDVSIYKNLLFVSGEGYTGRLDCSDEGVREAVSHHRLRGIRIFDITDIRNPKNVANVQTCRGSHTHTVLADPKDPANIYVYVSGSAPVRPAAELAGCSDAMPETDANTALFRIEVIKVPLADPSKSAIVSSPRIFEGLEPAPRHAAIPGEIAAARARGQFIANVMGQEMPLPVQITRPMLDSIVKARNGTGTPTAADSAALRGALPAILARMLGNMPERRETGPTQCHDITVYPEIGLAGGACEGYGMLLDISNPANPRRISFVADSNFAYWHSATFSNDGSKILFTDEWGGGSAPKCRAIDKPEWGANAIFTIDNGQMKFQSYFKLPAEQTEQENCVAHNGSLIPIPGRDVMVQGWYQGGILIFDWTDPKNPIEIAYHDRGPVDSTRMGNGGSWSVYWYNGLIVNSEIARGLDIFELVPSGFISQNEIDAAKSVKLEYLNPQMQPKFVWPPSFALAKAFVDQLERSRGLSAGRIGAIRQALSGAERASGSARSEGLNALASQLDGEAGGSRDTAKVRLLSKAVKDLAAARS
ncbi:MAG: LVIVD repeat-containing protein [Gemmatimonadales bacterium]